MHRPFQGTFRLTVCHKTETGIAYAHRKVSKVDVMTEIQPLRFVVSVLFGRRKRVRMPEWLVV